LESLAQSGEQLVSDGVLDPMTVPE
jgi:hypothetical protein